jgi:predicted DNA-binding transcriptional regulator YafY
VVKEHENGEVTFGYTLQIDRDLLNSLMSWAGEFWVEKPEDLRVQLQRRADDLLKNLKK